MFLFLIWYRDTGGKFVRNGLEQARANKNDWHNVIDTAGRLQIVETLMQELHDIKDFAPPNEILLVVDVIGQEAANVAKEFKRTTRYHRCRSY